VLLAVAVPGLLIAAPGANAASFTVNDATDAALVNPAGTACVSTDGGGCTLRAAVQAADNAGGASTISVPGGDFKLKVAATAGGGADDPSTGDLDVKTGIALTIAGSGASATIIDATHTDRAFAVHNGASLSISGVTVENGSQPATAPSNNSVSPGYGGAFYNDGSLSINASVLSNDSAADGGGAVFSDAAASATSITNSTVTSDTSDAGGGALSVDSGSITLTGDTITHDSAYGNGGAVSDTETGNTVGPVTIGTSTISNNVAYGYAGALYVYYAGSLTITGSALNDDVTDNDDGGAIYDESAGLLTLSGSTMSGDAAGSGDGGAISTDSTDLAVSGSTFSNDTADDAGAVYVEGTSATAAQSITTSTFTDNDGTDDSGGAVYAYTGDLTLATDTFTGNDSSYYGGALYYGDRDGLALTNDTFDGNQAVQGGAIYLNLPATSGTVVLLNDTIARNSGYSGGGIAYPEMANTIENTIVADNAGGSGTDGGGDCYGTAATDNAAGADEGGNVDSDGTCFSDSVHNDHTAVNPDLGTLADNGGALQTDALLSGSPAIGDAINTPITCPTTDERGAARPVACDSGAFQTLPADLAIAVSAPAAATIGGPVTETLSVANNGPSPATGVTVTDTLPAGTTYFSSSTSQGTCAGTSTVTCSLGTLDSSATGPTTGATVTIVLIPTQSGSFTNTGTVSAYQTDPNHANNTASATTNVASAIVTLPVPTLLSITLNAHHKKNRFTFAGVLTLPSGMTAAVSCNGTVSIKVMHGRKLLSTHNAKVSRTCTYSKHFKVHGNKQRKIVATFTGNATLTRTSHTTYIR
jgi:uncharacterized repeat protein (TIGR01451 family)